MTLSLTHQNLFVSQYGTLSLIQNRLKLVLASRLRQVFVGSCSADMDVALAAISSTASNRLYASLFSRS